MQMVNHKKDKILQIFKRMEILRPRDLVAIGISGSYLNVLASTQHVHAGYDVDFARNKSCSDDLGQSTSPGSGCLSFAPSAEFSDTKVLNVMTQSRGIGQSQLAARFATGQFTNRSRSG